MGKSAHDPAPIDAVLFMTMADESAKVELVNVREWVGDPRLGRFHLYVDGKRAGSARPLGGVCKTIVAPGAHRARVRHWWYFSPRISFAVAPNQVLRLTADIPRELSVPKRMTRFLFHPLSSLCLRAEDAREP